jgi:hypothetical protein
MGSFGRKQAGKTGRASMNQDTFFTLSPKERICLLTAMHVRNEMEDFHCKNLNDAQMKELNQIIRKAFMEAQVIIEETSIRGQKIARGEIKPDDFDHPMMMLSFLINAIPDYWEIPYENKTRRRIKAQWAMLKKNSPFKRGKKCLST